jgi:P-type Mg2+ transporter
MPARFRDEAAAKAHAPVAAPLVRPFDGTAPEPLAPGTMRWLLALAALGAVVVGALRYTETAEFARIVREAEPRWLALAVACQLCTYAAAGRVYCLVVRAGGERLPLRTAVRLGLTQLFVDQAVPSAGLSGMAVLARGLQQLGASRAVTAAAVVVDLVSFYAAYVACLALALALAALHGERSALLWAAGAVFGAFAAAMSIATLVLVGRTDGAVSRRVTAMRPLQRALAFVESADPRLSRSLPLLLRSTAYQVGIALCDAATVWCALRALGVHAAPTGVFTSFMISSLARTLGVVPGGLGTFEAVAITTLHLTGVPIAAALSATLVFRGLSFWLPLVPGMWLAGRLATRSPDAVPQAPAVYWSMNAAAVATAMGSNPSGLSEPEAAARLRAAGQNTLRGRQRTSLPAIVWRQTRSPMLLLLLFAALVSAATDAWTEASLVTAIVLASVGIGCWREYGAEVATGALAARLRTLAQVVRDGHRRTVPIEEIAPGDVFLLAAGSIVPADAVLLEATDCHVSEAVLTGESFPVGKRTGVVEAAAPLAQRWNSVFLGTNVRSGSARCLAVATGRASVYGTIARRLSTRAPEPEFERGMRRFGYLLTTAMLAIVLAVFAVHVVAGRPPVETLLFAVALAVGLSPELLPAILAVNLARGARALARGGVLVRRLDAIETLGSMDVLCTDKTGTLTEGVVRLDGAFDPDGRPSANVLQLAARNAALQTGLASPLDEAILQVATPDVSALQKAGEIPFDFVRKRVTVGLLAPGGVQLLTKGAFAGVLAACDRLADGTPLDAARREQLRARYDAWSRQGTRVLAVAERTVPAGSRCTRDDERELAFSGFLTFLDRPKPGAHEAIAALRGLAVRVVMITGDHTLVARHVAGLVGLPAERVLTGAQLALLSDEALPALAASTDLFAEVDPNQKERILLALKKTGHVVGFLGDGVNDAPAMHLADTSISVEGAVDVARAAADFVLLERDLDVIRQGIEEGRTTFANTLKYVRTTASANLGNMASMAAASLFLPFLPMTASQILLNNLLSDVPAVGIAGDRVDHEEVERPRRWEMQPLGRFLVVFGALSCVFDLLTFASLSWLFRADLATWQTAWFVESLLTELVVALVVRTARPFYRSRPGTVLLVATLAVAVVALVIPYLPLAPTLGFAPLAPAVLATMVGITLCYAAAAELVKRR